MNIYALEDLEELKENDEISEIEQGIMEGYITDF